MDSRNARALEVWNPTVYYDSPTVKLLILGPPCSRCLNWDPTLDVERGKVTGISCCLAEQMYSDFSCFQLRE